jgi:hypothetical protein
VGCGHSQKVTSARPFGTPQTTSEHLRLYHMTRSAGCDRRASLGPDRSNHRWGRARSLFRLTSGAAGGDQWIVAHNDWALRLGWHEAFGACEPLRPPEVVGTDGEAVNCRAWPIDRRAMRISLEALDPHHKHGGRHLCIFNVSGGVKMHHLAWLASVTRGEWFTMSTPSGRDLSPSQWKGYYKPALYDGPRSAGGDVRLCAPGGCDAADGPPGAA